MKELDELITYLENDLLSNNDSKEIIVELVKKYAEAYHKLCSANRYLSFDSKTARQIADQYLRDKLYYPIEVMNQIKIASSHGNVNIEFHNLTKAELLYLRERNFMIRTLEENKNGSTLHRIYW